MNLYFIAIILPKELDEAILEYKYLMQEGWGCQVGLKSPAHITIIPPFWLPEDRELQLLHDVDTVSSYSHCFIVSTNNFSAFKPRTIFIDVVRNELLNGIKEGADNFFKIVTTYKVKIDTRPFHPHITIATRDLPKKAFAEAWHVFKDKKFNVEFEASGLSVLRHNRKDWDVINTSRFR